MIRVNQKGNFSKTSQYLKKLTKFKKVSDKVLEKCGREGIEALRSSTPKDTGETAASWSYQISRVPSGDRVAFLNSNNQNGVPIAIVLQYGHATRSGGWVEGRDYINPAIQPIFDRMAEELWKEVTRV